MADSNPLNLRVFPDPGVATLDGTGPLAPLSQNPYSLDILKYPLDLVTRDAPHYVRFDVNLPQSSKYLETNGGSVAVDTGNKSAAQQNADIKNNGAMNLTLGDVESAAGVNGLIAGAEQLFNTGSLPSAAGKFAGAAFGTNLAGGVASETKIGIRPKTVRTKTSISLYMPETVVTAYDHDWDSLSLTEAMGRLGQYSAYGADMGLSGAINEAKNLHFKKALAEFNNAKLPTELAGEVGQATGVVGGNFTTFALKNQGLAVNPHLEMVFRGTQNRRYIFEFDFQPRSSKEAQAIQKIIKTFRMYAAPEIAEGHNGRYFIPPAEFDIQYRFGNQENDFLAKISTCALTNIAVNYNQSGPWATFQDGMPVHIHVALTFMEIDTIHRALIETYGY